ncbi:phage late control D family protein [Flintibacter muris]|uniref:phage late control D family protein n=1 Tax=Flintibacter muris TaxID=2941327 RepID=UPI00203B3DF3|nr:contractile injection system protein, VgrG/Pvc8 family [Flintibacter muris]
MSNKNNARRTAVEVAFDGADITKSIRPYLKSMTYVDNEEDETDELQIQVHDRDSIWLEKWLTDAIEAASAAKLKMDAVIVRENWTGGGSDAVLPCGEFELDSVAASGPPAVINIKGTSLPFSAQVRQTKKSKAWENYTLSGIANEIAGANGMVCMYESAADPFYSRVEQIKTSDIQFLETLCHNAGISLKATNRILVLFDQAAYESKAAVFTIKRGSGVYTKYKLNVGTADTQYSSCRVSYVDPKGKCISATAKIEDYNADAKNNQQLEITAKVADKDEAKALAEKLLRKHNRYAKTASFTLPGNPDLVAGVTVMLEKWGGWDGKYIVTQAKHTVGGSGYTVQVRLRRVLEGY